MQATYEIELICEGEAPRIERLAGWRPLRVGRDLHADLRVDREGVEAFHAEIVPGPRGCLLDVRAPVWLDGRPLTAGGEDVALPDQCELRLSSADGPLLRVRQLAYATSAGEPTPRMLASRLSVGGFVRDVDVQLLAGELLAILGRSGSGKTTLLRALAGLVAIDGGQLTLPPIGDRAAKVGFVSQTDPLLPELTPRQTLRYSARLQCGPAQLEGLEQQIEEVGVELELSAVLDQRCATLSGGQARRVSIAAVLIGKPDVLLLDEPDSGLDPYHSGQLMGLLQQLARRRGLAMAMTTHSLLHQNLLNRVLILRAGEVLAVGPPPEVAARFGVRDLHRAYQLLAPGAERPQVARYGAPRSAPLQLRRLSLRRLMALIERGVLRRLVEPAGILSAIALPLLVGLAMRAVWWASPDGTAGIKGTVGLARLGLVTAVWLGMSAAVPAVVGRARELLRQELVLGVALRELIAGQLAVLLLLVSGQALLLGAALAWGTWLELTVLVPGLIAGAACGVCLGLAISAWAPSTAVALRAVPLLMIPQLLFGSLTGFPIEGWSPEWATQYVAPLTFTPTLEQLFGDGQRLRDGWEGAPAIGPLAGRALTCLGLAAMGLARRSQPGSLLAE